MPRHFLCTSFFPIFIIQFKPAIPVQLTRIVKLTNLSERRVEHFLKEISYKNTICEYLSLEQVFVRSKVPIIQERKSKGQPTENYCMVCSKPIYSKENFAVCPHCDGSAHIPELLKWLKTKTICPKCRRSLHKEDFIVLNTKKSI